MFLYFCGEIYSMRHTYIAIIACFFALSCNNTPPKDTEAAPPATKEPAQSKLGAEGTQKLLGVVNDYYALKNAMVATKADEITKAANQLATNTEGLQSYLQKDSTGMVVLKPYLDTIVTQSKMAAGIADPTCEKQRIAFDPISSAMYGLLKKVELKNAKIYHTYCPMAFNDKGAYWLSEESEIKNPYFGKKMLECGEVTDSL